MKSRLTCFLMFSDFSAPRIIFLHIHTYIHTYTYTHTYIHVHKHTWNLDSHAFSCSLTFLRHELYSFIYIHTYTYTYTHTYVDVHKHTWNLDSHAFSCSLIFLRHANLFATISGTLGIYHPWIWNVVVFMLVPILHVFNNVCHNLGHTWHISSLKLKCNCGFYLCLFCLYWFVIVVYTCVYFVYVCLS